MISETVRRVPDHTSEEINEQIEAQTRRRIKAFADDLEGIEQRLEELDREWDIERCLETGAATLTLTGLLLSLTSNRRWLLLSAAVQGFFMQHALQGWCPPLPVFRRLGIRTPHEIESERYALKALRGDFQGVERGRPDTAWLAAHGSLDHQ